MKDSNKSIQIPNHTLNHCAQQVVPKEEEKDNMKFQFYNFTVDTITIELTER